MEEEEIRISTPESLAATRKRRRAVYSFALGQALSILIAFTGIFSSLLAARGISIPTTQSALNYVVLSAYLFFRRRRRRLSVPLWRYILIAIVDVEANFFVVLAYRFTSITSVLLLDCFSIPSAMLISRVFLGSRYRKLHLGGVVVCLVGLGCTVLSDFIASASTGDDGGAYPHAILGDMFCLLGSFLYAASNVMQETLVKNHDPVEFLGMLGLLASCLSLVQAGVLEHRLIGDAAWDASSVGLVVAFSLTLSLMYSLTAMFLTEADATLFNLSLLTSDVYAVVYRWGLQHQRLNWLYLVAFACMAVGLYLYHQPPAVNKPRSEMGYDAIGERPLDGSGASGGTGLEGDELLLDRGDKHEPLDAERPSGVDGVLHAGPPAGARSAYS